MRVLVIGGGGREHALARTIGNSALVDSVYCAPGNGGIAQCAEIVDIAADDVAALTNWAADERMDLVIPGPEAPLVAGIVDSMTEAGVMCFGPTAAAAQLEASKAFTKEVLDEAGVPTAGWARFDEAGAARAHVAACGAPIVVKADGLAAGKGVTVAMTEAEAVAAIDAALVENRFGAAGSSVVIEEFLDGEEASFHVLADGETVLPLATSQDHKRAHDGDTGPNTGGMGAYSPAPIVDAAMTEAVLETIIRPTVRTMAARGAPFTGVLYAGLMVTTEGPKLLEYNVRFGDPECQVLLPRLRSDLVPALLATCDGELHHVDLRWTEEAALTVVMAATGYPGAYEKGSEIRGLEAADAMAGVEVFHAGTRRENGRWLATGGRVLGVTATGADIAAARRRAYEAVDAIDWPGGFCRRDIGWRAI